MPDSSQLSAAAAPESAALNISISTIGGLGLILLLSLFAVAPLFYPGYFQTHSGFVPLWNIADLRANFGNFGWMPHVAISFDPLRGDGLLPYYLAALLPFAPTTALKMMIGGGWLVGGAGMFLWLRSWLGNTGAVISALVYVYMPAQIAAIYVRGAFAETLFFGLLPWAILVATFLVTSPKSMLLPVAALFWLALGLSQLGLTLWALLFLLALVLAVHPRQALLPLLSAVIGTGLAAALYLLAGHALTAPAAADPAAHLLYPNQLFSAFWGFGASRPGWSDGLSLQLGFAAAGLSFVSVALWWRNPARRSDRRLWFFLLAAIALALIVTPLFTFLWGCSLLAYPWQLLGLAGLCLAVLSGALPWLEPQFERLPLLAGVLLLALLSVYPYLLPQFTAGDAMPAGPLAELGDHQLLLLDAGFEAQIAGYTVGLERGDSAVPLEIFGQPRPGDMLRLNVRWQPQRIFERDYKVFVHLVDAGGNVLAQFDGYPREGALPTSHWTPGEVIADAYPVTLPADASPGPYRAFIGLYDEDTLERLPVSGDNSGRVILDVR